MARQLLPFFLLSSFVFVLLFAFTNSNLEAQIENYSLQNETMEWDFKTQFNFGEEEDGDVPGTEEEDGHLLHRSLLYWKYPAAAPRRYYISYGALSANRVPCPPRSGRSYYTHNCYAARGPVHPYTRGCSAITRCRI